MDIHMDQDKSDHKNVINQTGLSLTKSGNVVP